MDIRFLYRSLKASLIVAILVTGFSLIYGYHSFASGFFIAALWNIVNLWFIVLLVRLLFAGGKINKTKVWLLVLLKFPVLYTAGYIALRYGNLPIYAVICGLPLVFLIITLKAAGNVIISSKFKRVDYL